MVCGHDGWQFSARARDDINPKGDVLDIGLPDGAILGVFCAQAVKEIRLQKIATNSRPILGLKVVAVRQFVIRVAVGGFDHAHKKKRSVNRLAFDCSISEYGN